jgi:hypothetical protein
MKPARFKSSVILALCLAASLRCVAQQGPVVSPLSGDARPVPILSGGAAFVPTWDGGQPTLVSVVSPVLLVPVGSSLVFESRTGFEADFQRRYGTSGDFTGAIDKSLEYMQLDYIGNKYVTVTMGRFLTPFNISMSVCIRIGFGTPKPIP